MTEAEKAINEIVDLEDPFVQVFNSWWTNPEYTLNEKAVFITLKTYARAKGSCFPSQSSIATVTGISRSTVSKVLNRLEEIGAIVSIERNTETGGQTSNVYYLAKINSETGRFMSESLDYARELKRNVLEFTESPVRTGGRPRLTPEQIEERELAKAKKAMENAKKARANAHAI